jgi:hypothetical protein
MQGEKEPSYTIGGNALFQSLWKIVWRLLTKLKIELQYDPLTSFLSIPLKECKSGTTMILAQQCLLQHYPQYPSYENNSDVLQLMNGLRKYDVYVIYIYM